MKVAEISGLASSQVAERMARGQVNTAPARPSRKLSDILLSNIITPFNGLLLVLAIAVLAVNGSPINALFGLVMIINSGVGIFQELKAKRVLDKLAILSAPRARVVRDGRQQDIAVEEVVLGDILHLKLGDQVVADGEFVATSEIEIDESLLTGESDPIAKKPGDRTLSGSIVVAGSGYIRVTAVGEEAYSSKIVEHAKRFQRAHSELVQSTNTLLKWISWLLIVVAPLLVWGQLRLDFGNWYEAVIHAAAAIVGMIPEGLVLLTSAAFMLATIKLARQRVLVQQMPAVEGLARVDTLLLDKTGTLTEGNIRFEAMLNVANGERSRVERVLKTLALRTTNPTNDAINVALPGVRPMKFSDEVPFSSARKWSAVTIAGTSWILGAPEILFGGKSDPIYDEARHLARQGKRVLVLMSSQKTPRTDKLPARLTPYALVVLSEKIRSDAAKTLQYFATQGVIIKVISGDSPLTVAAVARRVGLAVNTPFDARKLPADDQACLNVVESHNVFGRVQPEQKRRIAKLLQGAGHTVAMTGDGVNDALALKDADIGIAMNSGAAASKAVAEIVLMDNKFAYLPSVLAEGRRVIANIERVANLFIIKNVYSLVLSLLVTVAGLTYPYLPSQMTVISALTIGIPAFLLALAPNGQIYRPGFMRRVLRFAVPVGIVSATAMMVNYWLVQEESVPTAVAGTATAIVLMMISLWALICLARPLRGWKLTLVAAMAGAFVLMILTPAIAGLFGFQIDAGALPTSLTIGAIGATLVEVVWRVTNRNVQ